MADNYLENQYEAYLARKAAKERQKKLQFQRQLKAYKERLAREKSGGNSAPEQTKDECRETITSVFRFMLMVLEGYLKRSWAVMPRIYFFVPSCSVSQKS